MNNDCKTCGDNHKSFSIPTKTGNSCLGCEKYIDSKCIMYSGEPLGFTRNESNITLEEMFVLLDQTLDNSNISDWNYNYSCLDQDYPITNQKQFVERISQEVCAIRNITDSVSELPNFVSEIDDRVTYIEQPGLTSNSFVGIVPTDSYTQVIGRLAMSINTLYSNTRIDGVDWDRVYVVSQTPTTTSAGFNEILRQIELLYNNQGDNLPTFDTTNTCLPTKTVSTNLSVVVRELYESYCSSSAVQYDGSSVVWGCVDNPVNNSLTGAIQNLGTHVSDLYKFRPIFDSSQFDVSEITNCGGYSIRLKDTGGSGDGKVLVDTGSTNKQYLSEAIEEGDNVNLSIVNDKVKIDVQLPTVTNVSVTGSGVNGPLNDVLTTPGNSGAVYITKSINSEGKLVMGVSVDYAVFADNLLNEIRNNPVLLDKLCNINCSCQSCS